MLDYFYRQIPVAYASAGKFMRIANQDDKPGLSETEFMSLMQMLIDDEGLILPPAFKDIRDTINMILSL